MSTLVENRSVRQRPEEGFRRWYLNEYFDVIVWYESEHGALVGFQLCYDRHRDERAFTWKRGKRGSHFVSSGHEDRDHAGFATSVLHGDAGPIAATVLDRLRDEQGELPDDLAADIVQKVAEYNNQRAGE